MKCPCCRCEMQRGQLRSRGGLFFLPDGSMTPKLYTESEMRKANAVYLPPYMLSLSVSYPTAYICRSCSKIVVEY